MMPKKNRRSPPSLLPNSHVIQEDFDEQHQGHSRKTATLESFDDETRSHTMVQMSELFLQNYTAVDVWSIDLLSF